MGRVIDASEALLELGLASSATDEERAITSVLLKRVEGLVAAYLGYDPLYGTHTEILPTMSAKLFDTSDGIWESEGNFAVLPSRIAGNQLQLQHIPVRSVTSLHIDYNAKAGTAPGAFDDSCLKTLGVDYWPNYDLVDDDGESVCSDGILVGASGWPTTQGVIKVVYVAGYKSAELHGDSLSVLAIPIGEVIINETVLAVKRFFASKKNTLLGWLNGNLISEALGDYHYSLDSASVQQLVSKASLSAASMDKLSPFVRMSF